MSSQGPETGTDAGAETNQPIFPAEQAFVVQFGTAGLLGPGSCGRVEHVVSGHSAQFATAEEMFGFIDTIRREVAAGASPSTDANDDSLKERNNR